MTASLRRNQYRRQLQKLHLFHFHVESSGFLIASLAVYKNKRVESCQSPLYNSRPPGVRCLVRNARRSL